MESVRNSCQVREHQRAFKEAVQEPVQYPWEDGLTRSGERAGRRPAGRQQIN